MGITEIKNACDGLINRLATVKERISELKDVLIETSQTEEQRENSVFKKEQISKNCGTITKVVRHL